MKKIIPFLTLFILFGNMVSCEQVRTETNYYKPTIKEEYKEISKDEFVNVVKEKYNTNFNYQYAGVKVKYNDETDISSKHFRAKIKSDLSLENEDYFPIKPIFYKKSTKYIILKIECANTVI